MKALTVRQPWAWAIAAGVKTVENRTRGTSYRGPLAIHAGKGWSVRGHQSPLIRDDWARIVRDVGADYDGLEIVDPIFAAGSVIAVAQLVDSHVAEPWMEADPLVVPPEALCCGDKYAEFARLGNAGRVDGGADVVHLVLADVVSLDEPVPCRGSLGFWTVPGDVAELVHAQLAAIAGAA